MVTLTEIIDKHLKQGKDYLHMGGERYCKGDKFLMSDKTVTVRQIIDSHHFFDERLSAWHTNMFRDRHCEHCPELNARQRTNMEM